MPTIAIGIHVHAEPERLHQTLLSVRACTRHLAPELVLLPDGPDHETALALRGLADLRQLGTDTARGTPACFNRLASGTAADVIVLLESGVIVAPGWLDPLIAPFSDTRIGLTGPSTNRAWNEQAVVNGGTASPDTVARSGEEVLRRYGSAWRSLEPLHSLADFCYVVRREVVRAIGGADEAYGLGPCWEMDYNARAARAGFRSVWACGAFVFRSPFTGRREREERARFEASKRRYQDKFCALRLRGERWGYEPHCRGESCEHFAPPALVQLHMPLHQEPGDTTAPVSTSVALPMVSCIMPTRGRAEFVLRSVMYFQRQEYGERELIIVDDDDGMDLTVALPPDPRVRYVRVPAGWSIGAKRNRACELARGAIIAQWDDDDWYAPERLTLQVAPIVAGEAEICGLRASIFFALDRWEFWRCTPGLHKRMFVFDVHGGTLVYRREVWQRLAHYPNTSLAEDAAFLQEAVRRGGRLRVLDGELLFIYVRHARNAWAFDCGRHFDSGGWFRVGEPVFPPGDREFYLGKSAAAPPGPGAITSPAVVIPPRSQPLVSCIMPTANRRSYVPLALRYFLRQDYHNRELIVLDDGDDPVADLIPDDSRIRYIRLEGRRTIGAKRNLACELAHGDVIAHWDDDDWIAPHRLSYQVGTLQADPHVGACGLDKLYHYEPAKRRGWMYVYGQPSPAWVAGNTLCYRRTLWERQRFISMNDGEDTRFVWGLPAGAVHALPDSGFLVALIHPWNTSRKGIAESRWRVLPAEDVLGLMGEDRYVYEEVGSSNASKAC